MNEFPFHHWYTAAERIASVHAAAVVRLRGLPAEDRFDLAQDALLELWLKRLAYDSRRGTWPTFSERVIASRLASVMRHKNARCRRRTVEVDLDNLVETLPAPDCCIELRTDVRLVLSNVSPFDRAVAISLAEYSAVETGIRLDASRAAIYRSIGRLRAAFFDAGVRGSNTYARKHVDNARRSEVPA